MATLFIISLRFHWSTSQSQKEFLYFEWSPPWQSFASPGSKYGIYFLTFYSGIFSHFIWHSILTFYSRILSGSIWHLFWHSIWHPCWHLFWISLAFASGILSDILSGSILAFCLAFWHLFWHSIWRLFWHSILTFYLAFILAFRLRSGSAHWDLELVVEEGGRNKEGHNSDKI